MYGVAVAGFCTLSLCKDILFKILYFTRALLHHYKGETKAGAVAEGLTYKMVCCNIQIVYT